MRAVFMVMLGSYMSFGMMKPTWIKNLFVFDGHLIRRKCEEPLDTLLVMNQARSKFLAMHAELHKLQHACIRCSA